VVSCTEIANKFFGKFIPGVFIHYVQFKVMDSSPQPDGDHQEVTAKSRRKRKIEFDPDASSGRSGLDAEIGQKTRVRSIFFMNGRHIKAFF
jgi:hypothetical protein